MIFQFSALKGVVDVIGESALPRIASLMDELAVNAEWGEGGGGSSAWNNFQMLSTLTRLAINTLEETETASSVELDEGKPRSRGVPRPTFAAENRRERNFRDAVNL